MAGWLITKLGYGAYGLIDAENPDSPPTVEASVTAPSYEDFTRILQGQYNNNEEVRLDKPLNYSGGFEYVGLALKGTVTSSPVWKCVRCTWSQYKKERLQYLENIAWDDRATAPW